MDSRIFTRDSMRNYLHAGARNYYPSFVRPVLRWRLRSGWGRLLPPSRRWGNLELFFPTCMGVFFGTPRSELLAIQDTTWLRTTYLADERKDPQFLSIDIMREKWQQVFFSLEKPFTSYRHWPGYDTRKDVMSWIVRCLPSILWGGHATRQQIHASPSHFGKMNLRRIEEGRFWLREEIYKSDYPRKKIRGMCICWSPPLHCLSDP